MPWNYLLLSSSRSADIRYLRAFDMERAELANAYTSDATFSCSGSVKSAPAAGSLRAFLPEESTLALTRRSCILIWY